MARPVPPKDDSGRTTVAVLAIGGFIVLGLLVAGLMISLREPVDVAKQATPTAPAPSVSAAPSRLEPSSSFAEAKKVASAWHGDAVLVSVEAGGLDGSGVAPEGSVEFVYARPSTPRFTGGAETGGERLRLRATAGGKELSKTEERAAKARIAPEPNCLLEDAWQAAQRAGATADRRSRLRYAWSEKHARPVWEVQSADGELIKRLDGVSCSILTR